MRSGLKATGRLPAVIQIIAVLLTLAALLVFMCIPLGQESVHALGGVADMAGKPMDGRLYSLCGEWAFYYGELIEPGEFRGQHETINVPSSWEKVGLPLNGCATYRLVVRLGEKEQLLLYVPEISSAYDLWINGEHVQGAGVVSAVPEEGRMLFENSLIPICTEDGVVELVVQTSNYHYYRGGMTIAPLIGSHDTVHSWFYRTRGLYCIVQGCILMTALYHFTFYIFRRREKVYFIFSVLCCLCFARFLFETNGINDFLQWLPMNAFGIRVLLVLYFLHCAVVMLFTQFVFNRSFLSLHKGAAIAYMLAGTLVFAFLPLNTPLTVPAFTFTVLPPFVIFPLIAASRSTLLRESRWALLYLVSMMAYAIVGTATKTVFENVLFMPGLLTNMLMIMVQSIVLSRNYADAFRLVEATNANLECIVHERTKDLKNANVAMKELVSNISHDIKTPLTAMSVHLEKLLDMKPGDEKYPRSIQIAYNKNLDLQRLIQNLIEVNRIEAGQSIYKPESISLNGLLADIQQKYGGYIENEGLYIDVSSCVETALLADPVKIWSVFDNVIYNAVRYTEKGGITIAAEKKDGLVVITVSDTGCGIAPEHLSRIFERFYKASNDRGALDGDSGVGLYIVKSVMEGCGGSAGLKSVIGQGTSVILKFAQSDSC